MTQTASSTTGPPSPHHLIILPAAVVREMSSLQPNMQHREDQQGGPYQHHADMPSLIFDEGLIYAAMPVNGALSKNLTSSLTTCMFTNGRRRGEENYKHVWSQHIETCKMM